MAIEYKMPVLALTQLTVESLEKEQLDYSDIGYCRKMSFIADTILGIPGAQDNDDDGLIIQLVKHRDGERNQFIKIYIDWPCCKVQNVQKVQDDGGEDVVYF